MGHTEQKAWKYEAGCGRETGLREGSGGIYMNMTSVHIYTHKVKE